MTAANDIRRTIKKMRQDLNKGMLRDRHPMQRKIQRLQQGLKERDREKVLPGLKKLQRQVAASVARRRARLESLPQPQYPLSLPVVEKRREIAEMIRDNQVVVLCGETGSGKTTQLPKICLDLGRGVAGFIGMTQPRRIAARSISGFIAADLKNASSATPDAAVGFKMRFDDQVRDATFIKVMTDGILLAEIQGDRYLNQYDTLIIDEAHERSLNIDFLLGYIKRILPKRPDLKLIISSATLDTEKFSRHFGDCPVISISGRTYPVEVRYRPLERDTVDSESGDDSDTQAGDKELEEGVADGVAELFSLSERGDILVFLPGEREIRECLDHLNKRNLPGTDILPLFARLSAVDQDRIFKPGGRRRIVLATNVAETSITIPGISSSTPAWRGSAVRAGVVR